MLVYRLLCSARDFVFSRDTWRYFHPSTFCAREVGFAPGPLFCYATIPFPRIRLLFLFGSEGAGGGAESFAERTGKIEEKTRVKLAPPVYHRDCLVSIICRERGCDGSIPLFSPIHLCTFVFLLRSRLPPFLEICHYFFRYTFSPGKCSRPRRVAFKDTKRGNP